MGSYMSSTNRKGLSNEELFIKLEETRIERELAIAQAIESRKQAYKLAEERERLKWSACGGGISVALSIVSAIHHKHIIYLLPVFPITTYLGYMAHYCYGDKRLILHRIVKEMLYGDIDSLSPELITVENIQKRINDIRTVKYEENLFQI